MRPLKYVFIALFIAAVSTAFAGDIRMGINPNPANQQTVISIEGNVGSAVQQPEIFTLLGEKITAAHWRKEGNSFIVNTSMIPDGIYLVKYGVGNQVVVKRLRIQHQ